MRFLSLFTQKKRKIQPLQTVYKWIQDMNAYIQEHHATIHYHISHLHSKTQHIEELQKNHHEQVKNHLTITYQWINFLHHNHKLSREEIEKTKELLAELYQQHKETIKILNEMKKEHERLKQLVTQTVSQSVTESVTKSDTVTRHQVSQSGNAELKRISEGMTQKQKKVDDTDSDTKVTQPVTQMTRTVTQRVSQQAKKTQSDTGVTPEIQVVSVLKELNMSEKRVLYLLIHGEKPHTYQQIADKTGMNYSTVKNIVYRLRKRGIPIQDMMTRRGEKAFYLPENLKLALKTQPREP